MNTLGQHLVLIEPISVLDLINQLILVTNSRPEAAVVEMENITRVIEISLFGQDDSRARVGLKDSD